VARQWNGRQGKVDSCQVGVFGALRKGHLASLADQCLYLPKEWVDNPRRCRKGGEPERERLGRSRWNWPWRWSATSANWVCSTLGWGPMGAME
jgi:SRSO17 transposase